MTGIAPPDDRVAAILARFPGPVSLRISRRKWLWFLAIGLTFATIGGWMILDPALFDASRAAGLSMPGTISAVGWATLAFFGLGSVVIIVTLLPGASGLTLDPDGFIARNLFRRSTHRWADVGDFAVSEVPLGQGARTMKVVGFNDRSAAEGAVARMSVALAGRNSALPDTYGLAVADLVRLMSSWRTRALPERY